MFDRLFRGGGESRGMSFQVLFGGGADELGTRTAAGETVSPLRALTLSTGFACVRLLADAVSTMPVDVMREGPGGAPEPVRPRPRWLVNPQADRANVTSADYFHMIVVALQLWGNAYVVVVRDRLGEPLELHVLDPRRVTVERDESRRVVYRVTDTAAVYSDAEIIHIVEAPVPGDLVGVSPVGQLRETIGLSLGVEQFAARFFGQGGRLGGVIEVPGMLDAEQARELQDQWERGHRGARRSHRPGVLSGGATWRQTTAAPDTAQALETRRHQVEEVCRAFGVPPFLVGHSVPGAVSYASVEERNRDFVGRRLRGLAEKIERAHNRLLPEGQYLRFDFAELLRGDMLARAQHASTLVMGGIKSPNEARAAEGLPPVERGDELRVPLQNVPLSMGEVAAKDRLASIASTLVTAGYDPGDVAELVGWGGLGHTGLPSVQLQPEETIDDDDDD